AHLRAAQDVPMSRTLDAGTFYSASPAAGPWRAFAWAGPYAPLLALYAIGLLTLSASRIALMLWQDDRVAAAGRREPMLLQGVRVDIILLGLMAAVPLLLLPLLVSRRAWPLWRALTYGWVIAMVALLVFLEVATPAFIVEYGVRPNRFLIEYLKYPRE